MRLAVLAAALLAWAAAAGAQNVSLQLQPGETLLEVDAEGIQRDRPDVMEISAGVVTTGATAGEALGRNSAIAAQIVAAVRALGIEPRDVRTSELSIRPRYAPRRGNNNDDEEEDRPITGYVASNNVEIRLRDLGRSSDLLDAMLRAGANNVSGPSFSLSDDRRSRLAAQREAVRLAREEAEAYAEALDMRVVRTLRVSERSRYTRGDNTIIVTGSLVRGAPIEPGEVETEVTVWVDFALAPR